MKKRLCLLLSCLLLCACNEKPVSPAPDAPEETPEQISTDVIFIYNGKEYDLREREESVNALIGETRVGDILVVEGHISPDNAYYGIFDAETETFVKDIVGANLTWRDDDISTAAYSFWNEICDYNGDLLGEVELAEGEYVRSLTWTGSRELSVGIYSDAGEKTAVLELEG